MYKLDDSSQEKLLERESGSVSCGFKDASVARVATSLTYIYQIGLSPSIQKTSVWLN